MIKLNISNALLPRNSKGVSLAEVENTQKDLLKVKKRFLEEDLGFKNLPYVNNFDADFNVAKELMNGKDSIVVIGIGGSDLGTRAIMRALTHTFSNLKNTLPRIFFAGDTTDPEALTDLLEVLDLNKTLWLVVSKSGNTIEQASVFVYVKSLYEKNRANILNHFLFITDPTTGTLRDLALRHGFKTISIPQNVGGRFSVLSSVGIVPSFLKGLNYEQMLNGARDLHEHIKSAEIDTVLEYVTVKYSMYKSGKDISVLMPYQYCLYEFAKWYQQLWAESLGKRISQSGKEVFEGQTPIAALGPVDQHSQLQLYNEGPNDKFFTFIGVEESRNNLKLNGEYKGFEEYDFFKEETFHEILNCELKTTAYALTKNSRPNVTLTIPKVNEYCLGQLFYFFEVAVTYFGFMLNINPFDQPGVELSKNAMYGILCKKGYEKEKEDYEKFIVN